MNLAVITDPPFEPVSLAQVYAQLRLDPDSDGDSPPTYSHPDDALLTGHIVSARQHVEAEARRSLVRQTLRLSMPSWPVAEACWPRDRDVPRRIRLVRPPVIGVLSVRYYDAENVLQTVSPGDYYVTDEQVPELRFVTTFVRPTLYDRPDAVRVEYEAGYAADDSPATTQEEAAANVPQTLKDAVLLGVQLLYDNLAQEDRDALERARAALIWPLKVMLEP